MTDKPLYRRGDWVVVSDGIDHIELGYFIEASRLTEEISTHSWPEHIAEKNSSIADLANFVDVWLWALAHFEG